VALLHQRHMLVGGGVQQQIGGLGLHGGLQMGQVAHIAHQAHQFQLGVVQAQLLLDGVEAGLAPLIQHQARRPVARGLAAEFAADAAAGTGDEDGGAADHLADTGLVQLHRLAAQQVFGLDVAHPLQRCAGLQLFGTRHREDGQAGGGGQIDDATARSAAQRGHGDHQMRERQALGPVDQLIQRAQHRHAGHAVAALGGVVVQQAVDQAVAVAQTGDQARGRLAGSQHQNLPHCARTTMQTRPHVFVKHAVDDARQHQGHQGHDGVQGQHGARHLHQPQGAHRQAAHDASHQADEEQAFDLTKAREAPDRARHLQGQQGGCVQRQQAGQHGSVVGRPGAEPALKPKPEEIGGLPGQGDQRQIGEQGQAGAARAQAAEQLIESAPGAQAEVHGVRGRVSRIQTVRASRRRSEASVACWL